MLSNKWIGVEKQEQKFIIKGEGVSNIYSSLLNPKSENYLISTFHGIENLIKKEINEYNKRTFDSVRAEHPERVDDVGELSGGASKFSIGNLFRTFLRRKQA